VVILLTNLSEFLFTLVSSTMTVGPRYCAYFSPIIRPPLAIGHSRFSIRSISLGLLRVSGFGFRVSGSRLYDPICNISQVLLV